MPRAPPRLSHRPLIEMKVRKAPWMTAWQVLKKVKHRVATDPGNQL
jgi:hypothetical protein